MKEMKTPRTVRKERKEGHCWRELNNWDTFFYVHYMIDFPPKMLARSAVIILACPDSPMNLDHPVLYLYIFNMDSKVKCVCTLLFRVK